MGLFELVLSVIPFLIILFAVFSAAFIIHTQEAGIVERLGKFHKVAHPGLNFKIPFVDTLRARISGQVQQLMVEVETKTKDNVFVSIPVAVQYQVVPGREKDAFYALQNPTQQIVSYVQDNVRTSLASMNLDAAFESKDAIAASVESTLSDRMGGYGWSIINTLVTDIRPATEVMNSMNQINAAQRQREAAISLAEAEKIKMVKEAEGEAEAKRLQGEGVANQRKAIALGLADQYKMLRNAGVKGSPEHLLLMTQYLDTMAQVAKNGKSSVLFMPSNPAGVNGLGEEIRNAVLSADSLIPEDLEGPQGGSTATA